MTTTMDKATQARRFDVAAGCTRAYGLASLLPGAGLLASEKGTFNSLATGFASFQEIVVPEYSVCRFFAGGACFCFGSSDISAPCWSAPIARSQCATPDHPQALRLNFADFSPCRGPAPRGKHCGPISRRACDAKHS